jgi:predicted DNA-binding protein (UPF0251 family)
MARPQTPRRIRRGLSTGVFKPLAASMRDLERVELTLDALEAIRLADLEGLYQSAAAEHMGISRATFGRVLAEGRRAVADALLHGKALVIEGGSVEHRGRTRQPCPVHGPQRRGRDCKCASPRRPV